MAKAKLRDVTFRVTAVRLMTQDFAPGVSVHPERNFSITSVPSGETDAALSHVLSGLHNKFLRGRDSLTFIELLAAKHHNEEDANAGTALAA